MAEPNNSLVSNDPNAPSAIKLREDAENALKAELLKEISLEDVRLIVDAVRSGAIDRVVHPHDSPDTFDEYGRNFRRMVHRYQRVGSSGRLYWDERPFALSLEEARAQKPPADYFDITDQVWVLRGVKRQRDYPENTVGYWEQKEEAS